MLLSQEFPVHQASLDSTAESRGLTSTIRKIQGHGASSVIAVDKINQRLPNDNQRVLLGYNCYATKLAPGTR